MRDGTTLDAFVEPVEQHLFLFSRQHMDREIAGTHDIYGHYDLRIYVCRIWQDGKPVRDYLPCLRLEDGRAGMFDLTEGRFCGSDGREELLAGRELLPVSSVEAVNGWIAERVPVPKLPGFVFQGYFTGPGGNGMQIIDREGNPCCKVGTLEDMSLYAHWTRNEAYFELVLLSQLQQALREAIMG